jgi:hypothetical protein
MKFRRKYEVMQRFWLFLYVSGRSVPLPQSTPAMEGSGCYEASSDRLTLGQETQYSFYRRLGGPQGLSGWVRKNLAQTGFRTPDSPAIYRQRYPGCHVEKSLALVEIRTPDHPAPSLVTILSELS